jgi:hypothetical protein
VCDSHCLTRMALECSVVGRQGTGAPIHLRVSAETEARQVVQPCWRTLALAMLPLLPALGLTACSSGSASTTPTTLPPRPPLANFDPSSAVVTSQRSVQLAPAGPPQVAVTYVSRRQSSRVSSWRPCGSIGRVPGRRPWRSSPRGPGARVGQRSSVWTPRWAAQQQDGRSTKRVDYACCVISCLADRWPFGRQRRAAR